jgi:hypothetical protein
MKLDSNMDSNKNFQFKKIIKGVRQLNINHKSKIILKFGKNKDKEVSITFLNLT